MGGFKEPWHWCQRWWSRSFFDFFFCLYLVGFLATVCVRWNWIGCWWNGRMSWIGLWISLLGCLLFIPHAPVIQHILLSFQEICHHHQHSPLLLSLNIVHYSAITHSNKKFNGIAFGKKYTCFSPHLVQGKSLKHPQGHFIFNHTMHSSHRCLKQDIQTLEFKISLYLASFQYWV